MKTPRALAQERGDQTYRSENPCIRGHNAVRLTSNGTCLECSRNAQKAHRTKFRDKYIEKYASNRDVHIARAKQWRINNPEKRAAQNQKPRAKIVRLLAGARARARKKGLEFTLVANDITIPSVCPVLGIEIIQNVGRFSPNAPSLDRLDSTKGYTLENVRVISWRANSVKNDATLSELRSVVSYLEQETGGTSSIVHK